jgi:WhiB family redox-sensing transcriptional regulator
MSDSPAPDRSEMRVPWLNARRLAAWESGSGSWPEVDFDDLEWRRFAACRLHEHVDFFPVGTTGTAAREIADAKSICNRCPVRLSCLRYALVTNQEFGVWGGHDEEERKELRRQWRRLGRPFPIVRVVPADQVPRGPRTNGVERAG